MTTLLSLRQVMERLGVARKSVLLLIARGTLPALKVGRQWRFEPSDVEAFIEAQKTAIVTREALPGLGYREAAPAILRRQTHRPRGTETTWKGADRYLKH